MSASSCATTCECLADVAASPLCAGHTLIWMLRMGLRSHQLRLRRLRMPILPQLREPTTWVPSRTLTKQQESASCAAQKL